MNDAIQVFTTVPDRELAMTTAQQLLSQRLAACIQINGPLDSVYRWKGKVETSSEWVCAIKTRRECYARVESTIRELDSYDLPEIVFTELAGGSEGYLRWLDEQVC